MINRRCVLGRFAVGSLAATGLAATSRRALAGIAARPFNQAEFEAAQKAGRSILVEVSAPWCPVCKRQKPILSELTQADKFRNLAFFEVDFDTRKDVLAGFKVQKQSTLIVFKGSQEMGRSTGDTDKASIESLLNKAV